ncbi:ABC transporter G family member 37 [Gossypium arboreum]|uniref:ABC transporter G family member 37 n=1 Tax=Gossypium arboreum TaxID=29729 RepID=A0A0B0N9Y4_GOSAR|nr:ABC transporter G family member 37 [Gossypium arboreum]
MLIRKGKSDYIAYYFNENVADLRVRETCKLYMRCKCVVDLSLPKEREVAIVLNSEEKFYMLVVSVTFD